jgi:hypothetical protein
MVLRATERTTECLKPVIKDWDSLTAEEYAHRCDEDVKINSRLWRDLDIKLNKLYQDKEEKDRLIDYLTSRWTAPESKRPFGGNWMCLVHKKPTTKSCVSRKRR